MGTGGAADSKAAFRRYDWQHKALDYCNELKG